MTEKSYFDIENPVVRDELWGRYWDDEEPEEEISFELLVDAGNLNGEEFSTLLDKVDEIGNKGGWLFPTADYFWNYFYKGDEEDATMFTISGWANESVYEELIDCLDYYCVKTSNIA